MDDLMADTLRANVAAARAQRAPVKVPENKRLRDGKKKKSRQYPKLQSANPFLDAYLAWKCSPDNIDVHEQLFWVGVSDERRQEMFSRLPLELIEKYSWAIPDQRALNILKAFSPIIEIGCGKGYWARLAREMGVDILAFDKVISGASVWTRVEKGGVDRLNHHTNRSLFLCYPDDFEDGDESLTALCLQQYKGETVILVGERFGQTKLENPSGKSICMEAQMELASQFHMILEAPLESFVTSVDTISVWKRTERRRIDDFEFADVPRDEEISLERACRATAYLLNY